MRSRRVPLSLRPPEALLELLLVSLLGLHAAAVCPSVCSCSRSHREVDCSWRGLRLLPDGLQHNIRSLNLSHNRLHNLDGQLTGHTHLRLLDLSHNRLSHLPVGLPRSLWVLRAASNRLRLLDKNDTVHQWNLRKLDLSGNKLERATFINNTLINLCMLNLSHNHFWTLPTNMPAHLETIDLSHNLLAKVLSGSLDRLSRLSHFYLHANRFSTLPRGVLDKLTLLRVITLGNNPWACHRYADVSYLLSWTQQTPAYVLGCPCHTQPVCGDVRPGGTGRHFASYNQPPLTASAQDLSAMLTEGGVTKGWYSSVPSLLSTPHTPERISYATPHPFPATPISISTLPPRGAGPHATVTHLSERAAGRLPHAGSHLISRTAVTSSTAAHPTTQTTFTDTSLITQTPIGADAMAATVQPFTTDSPSVQTKKSTTPRTRSVRKQNQSPRSGSSSSASLPLLHMMGLLPLILQIAF